LSRDGDGKYNGGKVLAELILKNMHLADVSGMHTLAGFGAVGSNQIFTVQ
jgi:hypothetical protein